MSTQKVSTTQTNGGIGVAGLLTVVFAAAKVFGFISWSWLWVLSPIWISMAVIVAVFALVILSGFVAAAVFGFGTGRWR